MPVWDQGHSPQAPKRLGSVHGSDLNGKCQRGSVGLGVPSVLGSHPWVFAHGHLSQVDLKWVIHAPSLKDCEHGVIVDDHECQRPEGEQPAEGHEELGGEESDGVHLIPRQPFKRFQRRLSAVERLFFVGVNTTRSDGLLIWIVIQSPLGRVSPSRTTSKSMS